MVLYSLVILLCVWLSLPVCHSVQAPEQPSNSTCPPWTTPALDNTCNCHYGNITFGQLVNCKDDGWTASVPQCYCLTYDVTSNIAVAGSCMFTCHIRSYNHVRKDPNNFYSYLIKFQKGDNASNMSWCDLLIMNRTGQLCGRCEDGYALPVYSYSLACVKCSDYKYNWLKYIAVAFLPLTLFYIVVIIFRISATAGVMHGYVLACQLITSPIVLRNILSYSYIDSNQKSYGIRIVISLHSFWNLDFFRSLYTPFCLHPNMSTLQTLALDYVIAVYPLLLIIITYFLIYLHRNYPALQKLWRPFYRCFMCFRKQWEIKTSLIDAFATFLLLSYVKILNTSIDLLRPTTLYDIDGKELNTKYLFSDGTIQYFGKDHLPYGVFALFMILVFNGLPFILLCLHPCACFQKTEKLFHFIDQFQVHFKPKPKYFRCFAGVYFFIRIFSLSLSCINTDAALSLPVGGLVFTCISFTFAMLEPYQKLLHNVVNTVFLVWLSLVMFYVSVQVSMVATERYGNLLATYNGLYGIPLAATVVIVDLGLVLYGLIPGCLVSRTKKYVVETLANIESKHGTDESDGDTDYDRPMANSVIIEVPTEENTPLVQLSH